MDPGDRPGHGERNRQAARRRPVGPPRARYLRGNCARTTEVMAVRSPWRGGRPGNPAAPSETRRVPVAQVRRCAAHHSHSPWDTAGSRTVRPRHASTAHAPSERVPVRPGAVDALSEACVIRKVLGRPLARRRARQPGFGKARTAALRPRRQDALASAPVSGSISRSGVEDAGSPTLACGTERLDHSGPFCRCQGRCGESQEVVDQNAAVMLVIVVGDPFGVRRAVGAHPCSLAGLRMKLRTVPVAPMVDGKTFAFAVDSKDARALCRRRFDIEVVGEVKPRCRPEARKQRM